VFPSEVEALLYRHPAVAEVAVIGIFDAYRGETPKAFIILKPDYKDNIKKEEIIEWTKDNMASYKRPRIVEFRDALPRAAAGNILKRAGVEEEKEKVKSKKQMVTQQFPPIPNIWIPENLLCCSGIRSSI
jgi:long-chain acyl-CoA synthetase